eukprot:PLAT14416.1.p1 GENE.PLAT14416.1~~PLAT14416.1.p1  ORF type:complete len:157 (+),score=44.16 PLAT14416.1:25-471(+)
MAARAVKAVVLLRLPAGAAAPGAALGQAVGGLGINMRDLVTSFNADTEKYVSGTPLRVELSAHEDRTFSYTVSSPPTSWYVKKACGLEKGAENPGRDAPVGKISVKQVYEIAVAKKEMDASLADVELPSLCRSIAGTCRSMGIRVRRW